MSASTIQQVLITPIRYPAARLSLQSTGQVKAMDGIKEKQRTNSFVQVFADLVLILNSLFFSKWRKLPACDLSYAGQRPCIFLRGAGGTLSVSFPISRANFDLESASQFQGSTRFADCDSRALPKLTQFRQIVCPPRFDLWTRGTALTATTLAKCDGDQRFDLSNPTIPQCLRSGFRRDQVARFGSALSANSARLPSAALPFVPPYLPKSV